MTRPAPLDRAPPDNSVFSRSARIGPEGVTVPLKLTHKLLGRLVRAQRPSVTASVRDLERRGMLSRPDDGTWLLHGEPTSQLDLLTD